MYYIKSIFSEEEKDGFCVNSIKLEKLNRVYCLLKIVTFYEY